MEDLLTKEVIGAAIDVHRELGPGLLESAYQACLEYELLRKGIKVQREVIVPVTFRDLKIDQAYRIDLLVNDQLVIELKTVDGFSDVHLAQILTYMKFGGYKSGLLLNFYVKMMKHGIKRVSL
jgi:GxxExxY protein